MNEIVVVKEYEHEFVVEYRQTDYDNFACTTSWVFDTGYQTLPEAEARAKDMAAYDGVRVIRRISLEER